MEEPDPKSIPPALKAQHAVILSGAARRVEQSKLVRLLPAEGGLADSQSYKKYLAQRQIPAIMMI